MGIYCPFSDGRYWCDLTIGLTMGRKPGKVDIPMHEAKEKVLLMLAQGSTITQAMASVNRNEVTFRQ